jgi:chromosome segregation ATPase
MSTEAKKSLDIPDGLTITNKISLLNANGVDVTSECRIVNMERFNQMRDKIDESLNTIKRLEKTITLLTTNTNKIKQELTMEKKKSTIMQTAFKKTKKKSNIMQTAFKTTMNEIQELETEKKIMQTAFNKIQHELETEKKMFTLMQTRWSAISKKSRTQLDKVKHNCKQQEEILRKENRHLKEKIVLLNKMNLTVQEHDYDVETEEDDDDDWDTTVSMPEPLGPQEVLPGLRVRF